MAVIQINYSDKKLDAINFYLSKEGSALERELDTAMLSIWEKYVPEAVRSYIESTDKPLPVETPPKKRGGARRKGTAEPSDVIGTDIAPAHENAPCGVEGAVCGDTTDKHE